METLTKRLPVEYAIRLSCGLTKFSVVMIAVHGFTVTGNRKGENHHLPLSMCVEYPGSAAFVIVQTTTQYFHIAATLNYPTITFHLVQVRSTYRLSHSSAVRRRARLIVTPPTGSTSKGSSHISSSSTFKCELPAHKEQNTRVLEPC